MKPSPTFIVWVALVSSLACQEIVADQQLFRTVNQTRQSVFRCTFDNGPCTFQPPDISVAKNPATDEDFRFFRSQAVILNDGSVLYDRTSNEGTILFAKSGLPNSRNVLETTSAFNCSSEYCCFNAFIMMNQSELTTNPGSLSFYISTRLTTTILANISYDALDNTYWTNLQQTFRGLLQPFKIGIEGRNGDAGEGMMIAVDDVSITTGMCENDLEFNGTPTGLCDPPPGVASGQASITLNDFTSLITPGTFVEYTCNLGYDLIGSPHALCLEDGRWTTPPLCIPYRNPSKSKTPKKSSEFDDMPEIQMEEGNSSLLYTSQLATDCAWGPEFAENAPDSNLILTDSQLVLFPDNPITCRGSVFRWVALVAPSDDATPVYFSIWRPVPGKRDQYSFVGLNQVTRRSQRLVQFVVPGEQRLDVESGDVIGLIYKRTSTKGVVYMYSNYNLPSGMQPSNLYNAVPATSSVYVEQIAPTGSMTITLDRRIQQRLLPLLRVHIGLSDCSDKVWDQVTFAGFSTTIPNIYNEDNCWSYCRREPSCNAVTFNSIERQCLTFSYISTEIHVSAGNRSLVKICKGDCGAKMMAITESNFDVALDGRHIEVQNVGNSEADCELACRYNTECNAFSYDLPFQKGNCLLLATVNSIRRQPDRRSFRKWGCSELQVSENCGRCMSSAQCRAGAQCLPSPSTGEQKCIPLRNPLSCEPPPIQRPPVPLPYRNCSCPPALENGYIADNSSSSTAEYACNNAFVLFGNSKVKCNRGIWEALPSCKPECENLPTVLNGRIEAILPVTTGSNKQARVTCNSGYQLTGNPLIVCISSKWTDVPPCVPGCPQPPKIQNCDWSIVERTGGIPVAIRYSPTNGHLLEGPNTLSCKAGSWAPSTPRCLQLPPTPKVSCPPIPTVANAIVAGNGLLNNSFQYATYKCLNGFQVVGSPTVMCRTNQWDAVPVCAAVCGPIPTIANARAQIVNYANSQPSSVRFDCFDGYKLIGKPIVSCVSSLWSAPPRCAPLVPTGPQGPMGPMSPINPVNPISPPMPRAEYCGQPPSISYGSWQPLYSMAGNPLLVKYFCNSGFYLTGPVRLSCATRQNSIFTWLPSVVPLCRPIVFSLPQLPMLPPLPFLSPMLPALPSLPSFPIPPVHPIPPAAPIVSVYQNAPQMPVHSSILQDPQNNLLSNMQPNYQQSNYYQPSTVQQFGPPINQYASQQNRVMQPIPLASRNTAVYYPTSADGYGVQAAAGPLGSAAGGSTGNWYAPPARSPAYSNGRFPIDNYQSGGNRFGSDQAAAFPFAQNRWFV